LALTLAHQYISQMEEGVRDAVFGNVGSLLSFRVGAEDAEFLEKEFSPVFNMEDLVNLTKYHIYLKLMIDGVACSPFSATTLPPFEPEEKSSRDKIIKASRERYGSERKDVEERISKWAGDLKIPEATKKKDLYDAKCWRCGKQTKVTFKPDGVRPVYCKNCLKEVEKEKKEDKTRNDIAVSLEKAMSQEPVSFSKKKKEKIKKEIDKKGLKEALEESVSKKEKKSLKPGEKINF
jgi:CxxC-x17-CxxC domain-containing protein